MKRFNRAMLILGGVLVLAVVNFGIYQKQQILTHGDTFFLALAPADPRSLIQGDYMRLRYQVENELAYQADRDRGYIVIGIDARGIGQFKGFDHGEPRAPADRLLRFHDQFGQIRIVPDSFMFQEGNADLYQRAKYGVFKSTGPDNAVLIGLADEHLRVLGADVHQD